MTTLAIRKKLSDYLQIADEKKVKAMYALLEDDIELGGDIDILEYNNELAEAEAEFEKGNFISNEEMLNEVKKW
jgi:hypothetical protein